MNCIAHFPLKFHWTILFLLSTHNHCFCDSFLRHIYEHMYSCCPRDGTKISAFLVIFMFVFKVRLLYSALHIYYWSRGCNEDRTSISNHRSAIARLRSPIEHRCFDGPQSISSFTFLTQNRATEWLRDRRESKDRCEILRALVDSADSSEQYIGPCFSLSFHVLTLERSQQYNRH